MSDEHPITFLGPEPDDSEARVEDTPFEKILDRFIDGLLGAAIGITLVFICLVSGYYYGA
jgi:hypothetical protein